MNRGRVFGLILPIILIIAVMSTGCGGGSSGEKSAEGVPPAAGEQLEQPASADGQLEQPGDDSGTVDGGRGETAPADDVAGGEKASGTATPDAEKKAGAGAGKAQGEGVSAAKPAPAGMDKDTATLWITKDFGAQVLLAKEHTVGKNDTVFDMLDANAEVETAYGGAFISGINGLKSNSGGLSGKRMDWFYYVNGIFVDVGALDYRPNPGDVVWWDYHPWISGVSFPAVIGCYPEPFVHGYRGKTGATMILAPEQNSELAGELKQALESQGAGNVKVEKLDDALLKDRQGPTIVVGEWNDLKKFEYLEGLNRAHRKTGICLHFTDEGVNLLDFRGEEVKRNITGAGIITATGEGSGDGAPLWIISGTDDAGLRQAVNVLVERPGEISKLYGAAIISGKITALPVPGT